MSVRIMGLNLLKSNFYSGINVIQNAAGYNVYVKEIQIRLSKKSKGQRTKKQTSNFQVVSPAFKSSRNESDEQRVRAI